MTMFVFLFGLAIFLFAMRDLERGIRLASGEGLKSWIVERTNTAVSAAGYGVLVTAIMQSSSMVSLIVLAFVSAEIMPLFSGIGVVLGANLGTTVTGWVVTVVGFKMDLEAMVIPLLGLGAACRLNYVKSERIAGIGVALFGFGLLIFGLDIMKNSVAGISDVIDINSLKDLPAWVYLLVGLLLAAIMQSSSAVMIITLSMLNSDIVQLGGAAAVVIGADLGTTSTTVLGSLGQSVIKKQLAIAHVFFNVLVNALAFLFLLPVLPQLLGAFAITDSMFGLVAFHSMFNFMGLLLFLPLLKYYTRIIQRLLPTQQDKRTEHFSVPLEVPDAAINSSMAALSQLASDALRLNLQVVGLDSSTVDHRDQLLDRSLDGTFEEQYEGLKKFEGDLVRYTGQLRLTKLTPELAERVAGISKTARALVYASKTLKDVRHDFQHLRLASDASLGEALEKSHQRFLTKFYSDFIPLLFGTHDAAYLAEKIDELTELNAMHQQEANAMVSAGMAADGDALLKISTWFNLNHELHHYARYMLNAVAP